MKKRPWRAPRDRKLSPQAQAVRDRDFGAYIRFRLAVKWSRKDRFFDQPWRVAGVISLGLAMVHVPLDFFALATDQAPTTELAGAISTSTSLVLLLGLMTFNAWMIDRFLAWTTLRDHDFRYWLRVARRLAASVPILGLWTIVVWQRVAAARPSWALHQDARSGPVSVNVSGSHGPARATWARVRQLLMLFFMLSTMLPILLMMAHPPQDAKTRTAYLILDVALRLCGFAFMLKTFLEAAREFNLPSFATRILVVIAALWLVPVPFLPLSSFLLFGIVDVYVTALQHSQQTLTRQAFEGSRLPHRDPLWQVLEERIRKELPKLPPSQRYSRVVAELEVPKQTGTLEARARRLQWSKGCFLLFEAAALSWMLVSFLSSLDIPEIVVSALISALWRTSLVLAIIGWLGLLAARLLRRRLQLGESGPYFLLGLRWLGLTQVACFLGLLLGEAVAWQEPEATGFVMAITGFALFLLWLGAVVARIFPPLPGDSKTDLRPIGPGLLAAFPLIILGGSLAESTPGGTFWFAVRLLVLAFPVLGLPVCSWQASRLGGLRELGRATSQPIAGPLRRFSPVLAWTAALPFGGLFVPLWIYCLAPSSKSDRVPTP